MRKHSEIKELREVIQNLVPLLTQKGLVVTQQGAQAYVRYDHKGNPERVNIPYLPDDATDELVIAIHGFVDHEVAHVLFTDQNVGLAERKANAHIHSYWNIIEDCLIEKLMGEKFPGSKSNLHKLHGFFLEKLTQPAIDKANGEPDAEFNVVVVPAMRALSGQKVMNDFMDAGSHWDSPRLKEVMGKLPKGFEKRMEDMRSTKDAFALAKQLYDAWFTAPPPKPPAAPPMPSPPSAESEPEDGEKADDPAGEGSNEDKPEDKDDKGTGGEDAPSDEKDDKSEETEDYAKPEEGDDDAKDGDDKPEDAKGDDDKASPEEEDAGEDGDADAGKDEAESGSLDSDGDEDDDGDGDKPEVDADGEDSAEVEKDDDDGQADDESEDESETVDVQKVASDEEGKEGEADADAEGAGGEADGDPEGGEQEAEPGEEQEGEGQRSAGSTEGFPPPPPGEDPFAKAVAGAIEDEAIRQTRNAPYKLFSRDYDEIEPYKRELSPSDFIKFDDATRAMIAPLQKDLERAIAARTSRQNVPGFRSGRLHQSGLHKLAVGDVRVFRRRFETSTKATAVTLLIDNSGSMAGWGGGSKIEVAMQAGYALGQTLERINVPCEILGFTTGDLTREVEKEIKEAEAKMGSHYTHYSPLIMKVFKDFKERMTPVVKQSMGYMALNKEGMAANADADAIETAGDRLLKRPEERKILIVFSDGQPAASVSSTGRPAFFAYMHTVIERLAKQGVETLGVGIQSDAVRSFYPKHVILNDVADLPTTIIREIKTLLMK